MIFFSPALLTSNQFLFRDSGRMHLPDKHYLAEEFAKGHLPQWNPYAGLGAPLIAGAVDAVQHPFNLLFILLPFDMAFKLWVLLSYLVAGMGGWYWAQRLGREATASVLAGLAFALSGFLVSSSDNLTYLTTLAMLPWLFATAHDWIQRGEPRGLALLGFASALAAAGGDPLSWGIAVLTLPLYGTLFVDRGQMRKGLVFIRGLLALGSSLVAAAPFVMPVAAWISYSSRGEPFSAIEYERWNLHPLRLLEFVVPHLVRSERGTLGSDVYQAYAGNEWCSSPWVLSLYVGVPISALAILGALKDRRACILVLGAITFTWMAMGPNAGFGQLAHYMPLLANLRYWEKLAVWPTLFLAMASSFGFERLIKDRITARRFSFWIAIIAVLTLGLRIAGLLFPGALIRLVQRGSNHFSVAQILASNLMDGLLEAGLVSIVLAFFTLAVAHQMMSRHVPQVLLLIACLDLMAANVRAYVLSPPVVAHANSHLADFLNTQPGLQRIVTPFDLVEGRWPELLPIESTWLWGQQTMAPAWNVAYRVGNFETYAAMIPARTMRFRRRAGLVKQLPNVGLWNVSYVVVPQAPDLAGSMNLPPPYEVAASDPSLPAFLVRVPHRDRAYLAKDLVSVDRRGAMDFVLNPASITTDRSVVEAAVPLDWVPPTGRAEIVFDSPEHVELRTSADRRALLVLNDTYAPGWRATVDGRPTEILPANYLARGLWVGPGEHTVRFTYRTPLLYEGWALFLLGGLGLAGWALHGALLRRRRGEIEAPLAGS